MTCLCSTVLLVSGKLCGCHCCVLQPSQHASYHVHDIYQNLRVGCCARSNRTTACRKQKAACCKQKAACCTQRLVLEAALRPCQLQGAPADGTPKCSSTRSCKPSRSKTPALQARPRAATRCHTALHARHGPAPGAPPSKRRSAATPAKRLARNQCVDDGSQ